MWYHTIHDMWCPWWQVAVMGSSSYLIRCCIQDKWYIYTRYINVKWAVTILCSWCDMIWYVVLLMTGAWHGECLRGRYVDPVLFAPSCPLFRWKQEIFTRYQLYWSVATQISYIWTYTYLRTVVIFLSLEWFSASSIKM